MKKIILLIGIFFWQGCSVKPEKICVDFVGLNECNASKECMPLPAWKPSGTGTYDGILTCIRKRPYDIKDLYPPK